MVESLTDNRGCMYTHVQSQQRDMLGKNQLLAFEENELSARIL